MRVGVRARTILYASDTDGRQRAFQPGEVVYVGKQIAKRWIAERRADALPPPPGVDDMAFSCGVMVSEEGMASVASVQHALAGVYPELKVAGAQTLNFSKTLLLSKDVYPRPAIVGLGFKLLDTWQAVVPLLSYETLACDVGTGSEREKTKQVVRDLRVPLYDTRFIFMRRCSTTLALLATWQVEMSDGGNAHLAFLRAVYQVKPALCAGPTTWLQTGDG